MILAIRRAFRMFFLVAEHFQHQMDATWALQRGDYADYADCLRRVSRCESEILRLRMQ